MDLYIAAIGRSGSTALANWLTTPPTHVVFHEPNLLRATPTRLFQMQLDDWHMTREQAMAGPWGAKETQCDMHDGMIDAFHPRKVIVCVRRIRDAALSYFEKHRRQDFLERYSDQWVADHLTKEADGLVGFTERLDRERIEWTTFRYEEMDEQFLRSIADWVGWPGGGDMSRGLEAFGRGFETRRQRERGLTDDFADLASEIARRCSAYETLFYPG